jgi:hypothetical protein
VVREKHIVGVLGNKALGEFFGLRGRNRIENIKY